MKRPNYSAAKRARELKHKAKRDAKFARRQIRAGSPASQPDVPPEADAAPAPTPQEHDDALLIHQGT